jgi:hypothetical protein
LDKRSLNQNWTLTALGKLKKYNLMAIITLALVVVEVIVGRYMGQKLLWANLFWRAILI